MHCSVTDLTPIDDVPVGPETETEDLRAGPIPFYTQFVGKMDMFAEREQVAAYLQAHQTWFHRCAQPMTVTPLGENGYILTVGQFGALGFEVEPKIAVVLEPPQADQYWMHTIPLPDPACQGYEVDYQAVMTLAEVAAPTFSPELNRFFQKHSLARPDRITRVEWQLQMTVAVQFPRYIYKLPLGLIQKTGDRLLTEIVRQVSPRLTYKVQQDFHRERGLPLPPKHSRSFQRVQGEGPDAEAPQVLD
ncbi:DUF1997 domain-containing protein [Synechocystis sp. LKSZ1]|uniref:DUF1997 domain-containing protein n=1 Tax=Synechocystis sp. LKSZ1 TaxID=3144951 RepID=UPI00336C24A2